MRITNATLTNNYLRNLNRNLNQMQKYQNQLSSGKVVSRPSDDPILVSKIMALEENIAQNVQYNTNIRDTIGWVETQDTAIGEAVGTMQRVRELMVYGANGSLSDTDRLAIKDEMEMQVDKLVDIFNANFDGRYIFAGQKTLQPPFKKVDGGFEYNGDNNNISREIAQGVSVDIITDGASLVGEATELSDFLKNVIAALDPKDDSFGQGDLSGDLLGEVDVHIDRMIQTRSRIGAIYNRLESAEERNKAENLNLNTILSEREDIDIAEKYMEYMVMSNIYQASLSVGAKVLQPSLLDYIR